MTSVSCSCSDHDYDWTFYPASDFHILDTKRGRRCWSCHEMIKVGSDAGLFHRDRPARNDIEERIYGDEVPMSTKYMCEKCFGIYLSLTDHGYCLSADNGEFNMAEAIELHKDIMKENNNE